MARRELREVVEGICREVGEPLKSTRRRFAQACVVAAVAASPTASWAFGDDGAFNPRILLTGDNKWDGVRTTAPARWSDEVARRTSAPARLRPTKVRADDKELFAEPFVVWGGSSAVAPLTSREVANLRQFLAMGGVVFVDDFAPDQGVFLASAKREIARILPDSSPVPVGSDNVVFRSFYLLKRPVGRVEGPDKLSGIFRGGVLQVIFSSHDILGALARDTTGTASLEVSPGGDAQREMAFRLAVNIALYVLCSNYKDDQVHAELIMRRRGNPK